MKLNLTFLATSDSQSYNVLTMTDTYSEKRIREIVSEETQDIREDVAELKQEVYRHGVLFEEIGGKLDTVLEMLTDMFGVKKLTDNHEARIVALETDNRLIKSILIDQK